MRDFELSQIKDANEREIAIVNEKYARLMNDLKNDANKTAAGNFASFLSIRARFTHARKSTQ